MRKLYKEHKIIFGGYVILLTLIVSASLGMTLGNVEVTDETLHPMMIFLLKLKSSVPDNAVNHFFTILLIGYSLSHIMRRDYSKRCKQCSIIFAVIANVLILIARSYYKCNSIELLLGSRFAMFKSVVVFTGYSVLSYHFVNYLFEYLIPNCLLRSEDVTYYIKNIKFTFRGCLIAILIAWIPYLIVSYPANLCRDARDEIAQVIGDINNSSTAKTVIYPEGSRTLINNHHPVAYSLILTAFAGAGKLIGHINIGIFAFIIMQMTALACIYSYAVNYIARMKIPWLASYFALAFFMFYPIIPMYALTLTKDGIYGGFMILVTIGILHIISGEEEYYNSRKRRLGMLFSCVGLTLFRNNGVYILFITLLVLLVYYRKNKKAMVRVLSMIGIPIFFYWILLLKIIFPMAGIANGSPREMLSVPFQQVARYAVEWGESGFKEGEIDKINKILCFDGEIEVLKERYNPVLADGVKNHFNKYYTKKELKEFFEVWWKLFLRHPGTYIEATLNNTYDFYSLDYNKRLVYSGIPKEGYYYGMSSPKKLTEMRKVVVNGIETLAKSSMFGWAFSIGTWDLIILLCLVYMMYKKCYIYLLGTMPTVFNLLICLAGPAGYMRYGSQWICLIPIFFALVWRCTPRTIKE